jgi:hypothetical protein
LIDSEERISKRYFILKNLEYFIAESVYYRTYSEDMEDYAKKILYNYNDKSGSLNIK